MVLVNPKDPPQKCRGFFFKNNLLFIWLLKNCLYLCTIIITKSLKQNIMTLTKNNKTIVIVKIQKAGTKRIFFYPVTKEGLRLNRTNFARQYDAINLGRQYLNN